MALEFSKDLWLSATPSGAYHAINHNKPDAATRFLRTLLSAPETPPLTVESLKSLSNSSARDSQALLFQLQKVGWVEGFSSVQYAPNGNLDVLAHAYLPALSSSGRAMLADPQGFYVAAAGFQHEVAEELAALSASVSALSGRNSGLLQHNLRTGTSAWALVDAVGNSRIGFWPLYIGALEFSLVISGMPRFNHPDFVSLVWALHRRYGS